MFRILFIAVVLIVYGSLFPWRFNPAHASGNPALVLAHSWRQQLQEASIGDVVVNLLLYIPIGMFGYLAMVRHHYKHLRFMGPVIFGFTLSLAVEIAQIYDISRVSSLVDVACNTASSALGVILGIVFRESLIASLRRRNVARALHPSGPLVLVFIWIAYQILPVFPLTTHIRMKVFALEHPHFAALDVLASLTAWLIVARLLDAMYTSNTAWKVLLALILLVPAKIVIGQRTPTASELAGLVLALAGWRLAISHWRHCTLFLAALALAAITLRGLAPFHFVTTAAHFNWVPFLALLQAERENGLVVLFYKSFLYGAAVWLLWHARRNLVVASSVVVVVLAAIEIAQRYIPGHVPESTDPILALIFASIFWFLETHARRSHPAAPQEPAEGWTHVQ